MSYEYDIYLDDDPWEPFDPAPFGVTVNTLDGPHVTVAEVNYDGITVAGDAKRNKGEPKIKGIGRDLAVGRALIALGESLLDRAYEALGDER